MLGQCSLPFLWFHFNYLSGVTLCPPQRPADLEHQVEVQGWSRNDNILSLMERKPRCPHNPQGQSCWHFLAICSRRIMALYELSKLLSDQNVNVWPGIYFLNLRNYRRKCRGSWEVVGRDLSQGLTSKEVTNPMLPLKSESLRQASCFPERILLDWNQYTALRQGECQ